MFDQAGGLHPEMAIELSAWSAELEGVPDAQVGEVFRLACDLWDRSQQFAPKLLRLAADQMQRERPAHPPEYYEAMRAEMAEWERVENEVAGLDLADYAEEVETIRQTTKQRCKASDDWSDEVWDQTIRAGMARARMEQRA